MLLMAGYVQHAYEKCISIPLMNDLSIDKIAYFHWEILLVSNNKKKRQKNEKEREKRSLLANSSGQEEFTSSALHFLTAGLSFLGEKKKNHKHCSHEWKSRTPL